MIPSTIAKLPITMKEIWIKEWLEVIDVIELFDEVALENSTCNKGWPFGPHTVLDMLFVCSLLETSIIVWFGTKKIKMWNTDEEKETEEEYTVALMF